MLKLFRNVTFAKLFTAGIASQLGSVVGTMAFAYYLVDRFSSRPSLATTAELMYSLPTFAVFWLVGVIADLVDRKFIAVYSDWIRVGLTLLLLLFVQLDMLPLCFLVLFLRSAISKFFGPAEMGLLQGSMKQEEYVQVAGLNQMVMGLFMLFGMGLGAATYHFVGIQGAILIDMLSFVISGLLIQWCKFPEEVRIPNGPTKLRDIRLSLVFKDFHQGIQYIIRHRLLLILISGFLFFGVVNGVFAVLPIFTMKYKLSSDNYMVYSSLITVFLGCGFIIGSFVVPLLIERFNRAKVMITSLFFTSVLLVVLGLASHVWMYLPVTFIAGLCISPVNIVLGSWMPELVIPQNMGKVNALSEPIMMFGHSMALGFVALTFPSLVSVTWLHYILGICTLFVATFYLSVLPPLVGRLSKAGT